MNWDTAVQEVIKKTKESLDKRWEIGDIVVNLYGQHGKGTIRELSKDVKIPYQTLYRWYSASKKFPKDKRLELPGISFSHFSLLAKCVHDPKERMKLLTKASDEGWSVARLGYRIRKGTHPTYCTCPVCQNRHVKKV